MNSNSIFTGMRHYTLAIFFSVICLSSVISSCNKCYQCQYLAGRFNFYKTGDTIRTAAASPQRIEDTIQFYTGMGYVCDTTSLIWEEENGLICGKEERDNAISQYGLRCQEHK